MLSLDEYLADELSLVHGYLAFIILNGSSFVTSWNLWNMTVFFDSLGLSPLSALPQFGEVVQLLSLSRHITLYFFNIFIFALQAWLLCDGLRVCFASKDSRDLLPCWIAVDQLCTSLSGFASHTLFIPDC
jgi:hypothetical protein